VTIDKGSYPEIATDALGRLVKDAPALKDMDVAAQLELRRSALKVMGYLTRRSASGARPQPRAQSRTLEEIDLRSFVVALVRGTFDAVVNASIEQMEAYAQLLKDVAQTVDQFTQEADDRFLSRRQQFVAREVLTGIYRINRGTWNPPRRLLTQNGPDGRRSTS
jgi:hypothetical protein